MPRDLSALLRELEAASNPLDPGPDEREALRAAIVGVAERYVRSLDPGVSFRAEERPAIGLLDTPIAEEGIGLEAVITHLERDLLSPGGHPAAPGHLAYLSGGGIHHAALADFLAAMSNKYAGLFFTGPGPVRMENLLVRWMGDLVGYPANAGGTLASGGSLATFTAIVAARDAHGLRGSDAVSSVVYLSGQTHHCVRKSLHLAGLAEARVREIPVDAHYRMDAEALARTVEEDREAGLRPWLIAATAGTIDTGAVDPLGAIADVAGREGCWLHVDAAYGGFFLLTDHGRETLAGIERSDSVVLDPHKSFFLPWGTGVVLARDVRALLDAHQLTGAYLQDAIPDPSEISPADVSPELTKPIRALRMWLPLVLLGVRPFRAALEEKLVLARLFRERVRELGFHVGPPPDLSTVTFRWAPEGMPGEDADEVNRALAEAVRRDGRVFFSSTQLDGRYTLRAAVLPFRTHLAAIELALEILEEALAEVTS